MKEVTDLIMEFRDITIELVGFLEIKNYDKINVLIEQRQEIIDLLQNFKCSKEQLKNLFSEMNILELDKKAIELTQVYIDFVKDKLIQINNVEFVKDKYYHRISNNPMFFNKKI